jgi:hypothetical protein
VTEQQAFDPSRYLTKVGSSDYLEVKWRIVWLREVAPDARIVTELHSHGDQEAIFRAEITIPGGGSATGWGTETFGDFRDYLEKAETKALGRALAALGFGTQFCPDHDFGSSQGHVVDSPVDTGNYQGTRSASTNQPITPRQLNFILAIAQSKGLSEDWLNTEVQVLYAKPLVEDISRRDASAFIDRLHALPTSEDDA